MSGASLRRVLHIGTSSILLVGAIGDWRMFRFFVHALLLVAIVGEIARLSYPPFRTRLAKVVPVFRADEAHRPGGAFWLILGYAAASWVPAPGAPAGILSAACADPAASFFGSRWGGGKRKSWAGTGAAFVVAGLVLLTISLPIQTVLAASLAAATLERVSGPLDDNLVVAPGVALITWLLV